MAQYESIERLKVKNLGCIKELELGLTPLHALIGPNDSGKSTILRIVEKAVTLVSGNILEGLKEATASELLKMEHQKDFSVNLVSQHHNFEFRKTEVLE